MNFKRAFKIAAYYGAIWLAFMLIPALAGQPEVLVASPCGLILALVAGTGVTVGWSVSRDKPLTLSEAALAGALVGIFVGIVFSIGAPLLTMREEGAPLSDALELGVAFLCIGVLGGGLIGAILGVIGYGIRSLGKK